MEIIYRTELGLYPFRKPKQSPQTQAEHLFPIDSPAHCEAIRKSSRAYRAANCPHLMRLLKVLKDDSQMHFLYQYHSTPLKSFLLHQPLQVLRRLQAELACACKCLEAGGISCDIRVENLGVDQQGTLKVFVLPDHEQLSKESLQEFYVTQQTRLRLELQEIWQEFHSSEHQTSEQQPNFIISGNGLIFPSGHNSPKHTLEHQRPASEEPGSHSHKQTTPQESTNPHLAQSILTEIERQRELTDKLKHRRFTLKPEEGEPAEKILPRDTSVREGKPETSVREGKPEKRLSKMKTLDEECLGKKEGQRRSTGNVNLFPNGNQRLVNIGCEPSSKSTDSLINSRPEDRPISNLSFEKKGKPTSGSSEDRLQVVQPTANILGEFDGEEPKIQVTTEMISKYKMNIVTCEEIEFEGKEGEDIQQLAHEKLVEYQRDHGYPQTSAESQQPLVERVTDIHNQEPQVHQQEPQVHQQKPQIHQQKTHIYEQDSHLPEQKPHVREEQLDRGHVHHQHHHHHPVNSQMMAKILQAKEKASTALREYAKNKKR